MDIIIADKTGKELGFLKEDLELDLGETNDFEFSISMNRWNPERMNFDFRFYAPDTEIGGLIEDVEARTKSNRILMRGYTWRGLLQQKVIEPPEGEAYLKVNGELNAVIGELIGEHFGGLFRTSSFNTGIELKNYQFDRYTTLLEGIEKMLEGEGQRIDIKYRQTGPRQSGFVEVAAVPVINYSDNLEYSQESNTSFVSRDYRCGINHLICAGEGQEENRAIVHLYADENGNIGETKYFEGLRERTALYSYTSADDVAKLKEDGTKRLKELMNYRQFDMSVENVSLNIGDIVSGRDRITGTLVRKPIIQKILKITGGKEIIEYSLKGED